MSDEIKPDVVPAGGAEPAFDPEKMRSVIREELQQAMTTTDKDSIYEPPVATPAPAPTVNPLEAVINPIVAPHIKQAALVAEGARDAATFYISHPEAIKYQDELEKAFNALLNQGTPFTRAAVWAWYRGQNFDKFLQEARETDQAKIEQAKANADGGGGIRPTGGSVKDAHSASDEELSAALQNVSF